jgi:hypothetical protein
MGTLCKKLYYFARRPVCHEIGVLRFVLTAICLAAAVGWTTPRLEAAAGVMQLSSVHLVLATQLHQVHQQARAAGLRLRFCKSDDGLTCADAGGWEQGWIAFDDRDGDGVRGHGERILRVGSALPSAFVLAGDLNGRAIKLCLRDGPHPTCRPDQLSLALLSDGSRPRRS